MPCFLVPKPRNSRSGAYLRLRPKVFPRLIPLDELAEGLLPPRLKPLPELLEGLLRPIRDSTFWENVFLRSSMRACCLSKKPLLLFWVTTPSVPYCGFPEESFLPKYGVFFPVEDLYACQSR